MRSWRTYIELCFYYDYFSFVHYIVFVCSFLATLYTYGISEPAGCRARGNINVPAHGMGGLEELGIGLWSVVLRNGRWC